MRMQQVNAKESSTSSGTNSSISNTATNKATLSADTRHRLEALSNQFDEQLSKGGTDATFLKIAPGETKTLLFDPEQVKQITVNYPSDPTTPVKRVQCMVKEADEKGNIHKDAEIQDFTISITAGRDILRWVLKGFTLLDVNRVGSGMRDTKYMISPHL
jgi:hypothetical protein